MIKKIGLFTLLILLCGLLFLWMEKESSSGFQLEDGYSLLLEDSSLDGWTVIGGEATFSARGDEVTGRHGPGINTFLRTDKTYSDFDLKMQVRWNEFGNSGVLFRSNQHESSGQAYGYQYELDPSERSWSGGIYDEARRGWIANLKGNEQARNAILLQEWNDVRIEARGASLKTWINGVPAADIVDGLDAEGFIALQVHSGGSGIIRWRHIRIKEFEAVARPGKGLEKKSDWLVDGVSAFSVEEHKLSGTFTGEAGSMTARRQLADAIVNMQVPACEQPTKIRMRQTLGEGAGNSFAELNIYGGSAGVRVVNTAGEQAFEPVPLEMAARHEVKWVSLGAAMTISVDGSDIARLESTGLDARGQFAISPARCGESFEITQFSWTDLKPKSDEVLFYQTLDTKPAPVLSPEQALESFSVAPGFEVELVAAEPLVEDPVAMAWDEYGRLYVVEMRGYMPDAYGVGHNEPVGQVVRLEDTDGDGQMDSSEVFLGSLVNPRAVAVVNEGILIAEPPNLWLCEVPVRAALCENKRSVGNYAPDVEKANVEHLENRLLQGLDNWLYNSKSARRHKLKAGELQVQGTIYRGQWGISKDNYGRLFYNHNSTWIQADLFTAEDIFLPGNTDTASGLGVNLTPKSEVFSVRVNPGVNRAYLEGTLRPDGRLHMATGVSGLAVYRGDQFPRTYAGNVFVPEAAANAVGQFSVQEDGMELIALHTLYEDETWGQREFLGSSDERFRPVDAMNGPDGALYVIDMYRGIIQDQHFLTDELREQIFQRDLDKPIGMGRIWRVRHSGGKPERDFPQLAQANQKTLLAAFSHPNGWVRDTAQRLAIARKEKLKAGLVELATGPDTLAAIHAIWALQGRDELDSALVLKVAEMDDSRRQLQILRAGREQLQAQDVMGLDDALHDAEQPVRMQLAFLLGDHARRGEVRQRLREVLATQLEDVYIRQAVVRSVQGVEPEFLQEILVANSLNTPSEAATGVLATLAGNAYASLRADMTSSALLNPEVEEPLQALLALVGSRRDDDDWQQIAMLGGFMYLSRTSSFEPAQMASVPPLFSDGSIGEDNPLWPARLAARQAFTWEGDELALGIAPLGPEQLQLMARGEGFYAQCAACHATTGKGTPGLAPALVNSPWVLGPPEWLGRIILQGMTGPVEIDGKIWDGVMPPHGHLQELDDETLAGLMIYMRRAWGHKASPVGVEMAGGIRQSSQGRSAPWTVAELEVVAIDRGFGRFEGKYTLSFITLTIAEQEEGLFIEVPMYGGGALTQLNDTSFEIDTGGGEKAKIEFVVEADGSVSKMLLYRGREIMTAERKQD